MCISIHAPAKGATYLQGHMRLLHLISIHAPAKGATAMRQRDRGKTGYFNPRSREGSDLSCKAIITHRYTISIHAPAKGATCGCDHVAPDNVISIHAPAKGATLTGLAHLLADVISIHAPAKGATRNRRSRTGCTPNFNPRSREGSDIRSTAAPGAPIRFQSTLPRRERL